MNVVAQQTVRTASRAGVGSDHWKLTTLGECADVLSGGTPSKEVAEYWTGSIPWVSAKDMKVFRLRDTEDHVSSEGVQNGTRVVPEQTVLVLVRGMTLHNEVPVCITARPMAFNQDVKALIAHKEVNGTFLAYWLLASKPVLLNLVDSASHGTGRIHTETLKSLPIALPPLPEQVAIANALKVLDERSELNLRMNETLEEMARALFKSWFVDFDPVRAKAEGRQPFGIDAATAALLPDSFQDSSLGKIPRGWLVAPIGEVVSAVGGSTPRTEEASFWGGDIYFCTPKDMASLQSPILLDTERQISERGLAEIGSGLLPRGTVLLSSRAPIGYLAVAEIPVAVNQGIIAMVCDKELPNLYVLYWAKENMDRIVANANGTTFLEISKKNFRPLAALVPPPPILRRFMGMVGPLHRQMVGNLVEGQTLSLTRDTLLPKLISGEIRLKG